MSLISNPARLPLLLALLTTTALADLDKQPNEKVDYTKTPAFKEAEEASKGFAFPKGFKINVFAAEPQVLNPVAMTTDEKGRVFVIETFRYRSGGTLDMRSFQHWLDYDLAARTVEDRVAWIKKVTNDPDAKDFTGDSDRVRMLEDKDGEGRADVATFFRDDFGGIADGLAAGILARKGNVYLANIPSLYLLKDTKGDGKADVKEVLSTGYGVHFQLLGHDLHGLVMGPDGKLYFSIGDRGCHVKTKENKILDNPDSGVVFRCDLDGANLEMFATGLRNPQELAFDQYGNLFAADNNCDKGDAARFVYVVEGGETGWRMSYQWINEPNNGGPWMAEKLWHLEADHPAAWCLPPVGHVGPGPSGFGYYPGTGLGDQYKDHFFMCDFRGGASNSGIWDYQLRAKGASFELASRKHFLWNVLTTDFAFAADGGMYVADWVNGWARPGKGRIYKLTNPQASASDTRQILTEGFEKRPADEVAQLLGHADQRVRLEAQYELASRGDAAPFTKRLTEDNDQLARIHAIWGLGQLARKQPKALDAVLKLMEDGDGEIRAQAARVLGDAHYEPARGSLLRHLKDDVTRVRFFAAMGLAKVGKAENAAQVLELLRDNADRDIYIRHAAVMALLGMNDAKVIASAARDSSPAVRLAALLAMRRQKDPAIAMFLKEPSNPRPAVIPNLAEEAARAINDELIDGAMPALAAMLDTRDLTRPIWLRAINANLRLGQPENAARVAAFAVDTTNPQDARVEALWALQHWANPPARDRVMGLWRPLTSRDVKIAADAAASVVAQLLADKSAKIRVATIEMIEQVNVGAAALPLMVENKDEDRQVRIAALRAMETLKHDQLSAALKCAFDAGAGSPLRKEAIGIYLRMPDAADRVAQLFRGAPVTDQKSILEALASAKAGAGDPILGEVLDTLLDGSLPASLRLDLIEAAQKSKSPAVADKLKKYLASKDAKDPLAPYIECLEGGDAAKGRKIFLTNEQVACIRCHKIGGDQVVVGPDLAGIGTRKDRRYILESIVDPNAQIAPGFESVIVKLKSNVTIGGVLKKETADMLVLMDPQEGQQEIEKADIVSRSKGQSPMIQGLADQLSKRELRDLIEFLATTKPEDKIDPQTGHGN